MDVCQRKPCGADHSFTKALADFHVTRTDFLCVPWQKIPGIVKVSPVSGIYGSVLIDRVYKEEPLQLKYLRYFVVLARTQHFAQAARECNVSQPTLSAGLSALERSLGKRLVERDRRYLGLTDHGAAILPWAEQALGAVRGIAQNAASDAQKLVGEFRLAAIPAALPIVGPFANALLSMNADLSINVVTGTSREIEQRLQANEFDAGLTYLDHEPLANMLSIPIHQEQHLVIARKGRFFEGQDDVEWRDLAHQPLCLLHQGMQFRRILDRNFSNHGVTANPAIVTDSYMSVFSLVRAGKYVSVVPNAYAQLLDGLEWCRFIPIVGQVAEHSVGLVVVNRDPMGPFAQAGCAAARRIASQI
jgi:DNA-binding transcriptional LysR family regulator